MGDDDVDCGDDVGSDGGGGGSEARVGVPIGGERVKYSCLKYTFPKRAKNVGVLSGWRSWITGVLQYYVFPDQLQVW